MPSRIVRITKQPPMQATKENLLLNVTNSKTTIQQESTGLERSRDKDGLGVQLGVALEKTRNDMDDSRSGTDSNDPVGGEDMLVDGLVGGLLLCLFDEGGHFGVCSWG